MFEPIQLEISEFLCLFVVYFVTFTLVIHVPRHQRIADFKKHGVERLN